MRRYVQELVGVIGGSLARQAAGVEAAGAVMLQAEARGRMPAAVPPGKPGERKREVRADEVIPMGKDEFENF